MQVTGKNFKQKVSLSLRICGNAQANNPVWTKETEIAYTGLIPYHLTNGTIRYSLTYNYDNIS